MKNVEEMKVYQKARALSKRIYDLIRNKPFSNDYWLSDQIRRASVSILSNISEGFERGTNAEFIQFLYFAKGSCSEVRAQLTVAFDQNYISEACYNELIDTCCFISSMLFNLIQYLRKSRIRERNKNLNN
jgi:four helix bundle protein